MALPPRPLGLQPRDNSERRGWWPPCLVPAGWGLLSRPERPISLSLLDSLDLMAWCSCDASTPLASPSECDPQWTELGVGMFFLCPLVGGLV